MPVDFKNVDFTGLEDSTETGTTLDFKDVDFTGLESSTTTSDFDDVDFSGLQQNIINETTVLKNTADPEVENPVLDIMDEQFTGDNYQVTKLNKYLNSLSKESIISFNEKSIGKDLSGKLKEAQKLYKEEQELPATKFGKGYQAARDRIALDINWWEGVAKEKDPEARQKNLEKLVAEEDMFNQKWSKKQEDGGLWEGTGGLIGSQVAFGKEALPEAAAGFGIGAGTALVLGQAGPQAVLPEELLTVPALGAKGFRTGYMLGSAKASKVQGSGEVYKDLVMSGVKHETASSVANKAGYIYGSLEFLQLDKLLPGGKKIAGNVLKQVFKKGMDLVQEVGQESLQRLTTDMAKDIGILKAEGKNAEQIQKELLKNTDKYLQAMAEEAKATAGPMALIGVPGAVIDTRATMKEAKAKEKTQPATMQDKQIERVKKLYDTYGISPENIKKEVEIKKDNGERVKADAQGLVVRISELADEQTGDHEAFHVIANNFANQADYQAAKEEAKAKTGWENDADLDEYLADEFAKWRLNKEKKGTLGKVFSQITDGLKDVLGKDKQTRKLFKDFERGVNVNEQTKAKVQYQEELSKGEKAKRAERAIAKMYEDKKAEQALNRKKSKRQLAIDKEELSRRQREYDISDAELNYYKDYLKGVAEYQELATPKEKSLIANVKEYLGGKAIKAATNQEGKMVGEYEGFNKQFPGLFTTKEGMALDDMLTEFNKEYGTNYTEDSFREALTAAQRAKDVKSMKITDADALEFAIQDKEAEVMDFDFTGKSETVEREGRMKEAGQTREQAIAKKEKQRAGKAAKDAAAVLKEATVPGKPVKTAINRAIKGEKEAAKYTEKQALKTKLGAERRAARDAVKIGKAIEKYNNKIRQMKSDAKTKRKKLVKTLTTTYKKMWRELKSKQLPIDAYNKITSLMQTSPNVLTGFKEADYNRYRGWLQEIDNRIKMIAEKKQVYVNKAAVDELRRKVASILEKNLGDLQLQQLYSEVMAEYVDGKQRQQEYMTMLKLNAIAKGKSIKENSINKLYDGKRNYAESIYSVKQPGKDELLKVSDNWFTEIFKKFKFVKNVSTLEMSTPLTVLEAMDGGQKDGEMKTTFFDQLKAGSDETSRVKELFVPIYEKLTAAKIAAGKHWNKTKNIAGLDLTSKGKILIKLYSESESAESRLYAEGITPEQIRKVNASLTKEELDVYEAIRDAIDNKTTPLLADKIEEVENLPGERILIVDKYFPIKLLRGQGEKNSIMDLDLAFDKKTGKILGFDKGWMIGRSRHDYRIDLNDLEGILNSYVDRTSRYLGFADKYDQLWAVEKEIESNVTSRYGVKMTNWMKNLLNDVMLGTTRQESGLIKEIKSKTYGVHLSWNPRVWIVQAVSSCNGMNEIGAVNTLAGVKEMNSGNPVKKIEAIMKESTYMRNRTIDAIFEYYKKTDENKLKKLGAAGMRPIFLIDQMTAGSVWLGAKQKYLKENPGDLIGAIEYADYVVGKTQPQGGILYLPQVKRGTGSFGAWGQGLSMYMSQRFQNFGSLVNARVKAKNGLDKKAFAKAFMWIVLLPGILVDVLRKGRYADLFRLFTAEDEDDEDKRKRITSITGSFLQQAVPFAGTVSSMMEPTNNGLRFAQFGALEKIPQTVGETKRLIERQTPEQLTKTLLTGGEAFLNWNHVNTNSIKTTVRGISNIYSGKDLRPEGLFTSQKSLGQRDLDDVTDLKSKVNLLGSKIRKAKGRGDLGRARSLQREKIRLNAKLKREKRIK